ncbi:hypothetical protein GGR53DRAFT_442350 [Hypoxylon sp. FL1150]|nr:hypothetical protein GGR53DRAFT_442350 [Hypoxylon sp. FL1150]
MLACSCVLRLGVASILHCLRSSYIPGVSVGHLASTSPIRHANMCHRPSPFLMQSRPSALFIAYRCYLYPVVLLFYSQPEK